VLSDAGQDLAIMEGAATEILGFASQCVPDLLQTEDYARAMADADPMCPGDDQRDRAVQSTLLRQSVVLGNHRVHLEVVVTEGVVRQMVGGAEVMRRQLRRLANLGDDAGSPVGDVTVRVLPFDAGAHAVAGTGAVTILRFSAVPSLGVVHIGGLNGGASLDAPQDVRRYANAFTLLRVTALSPAESVRLLREMARALPRECGLASGGQPSAGHRLRPRNPADGRLKRDQSMRCWPARLPLYQPLPGRVHSAGPRGSTPSRVRINPMTRCCSSWLLASLSGRVSGLP
jgi:hypothetical protein